ncbi:hypothetical protein EJ08DRAFT_600882, partial [Tothia fuscella]
LLYINRYRNYINLYFLKYTIENRILIIVYLPYSTYLLKLLDLVLFALLASFYLI